MRIRKRNVGKQLFVLLFAGLFCGFLTGNPFPVMLQRTACAADPVFGRFVDPPDSARPWTYWFVMDGNLSKEGITGDLESMRENGLGGVIFMEGNLGIPRGKVDFMSDEWMDCLAHAVRESERLKMQFTLPSGPGWAGSGGPWIKPENSMLLLVATETRTKGPATFEAVLPQPVPRRPFFGEGILLPDQEQARKDFYRDYLVLAFPTPENQNRIADIDEKALYYRAPYSSQPGVKPRLSMNEQEWENALPAGIDLSKIVNLTDKMDANGFLKWDVPEGDWTIMRFGVTSNGANTRPAPIPGFGFETSKLDRKAFDIHVKHFIGKLLDKIGKHDPNQEYGWTHFHLDSWEMGSQNWSDDFAGEFKRRRGYDMTPWLPAYLGNVVGSEEKTERFLWDVRRTAQELLLQNHTEYMKSIAHENGLKFSIEPYDMNPCSDFALGATADVPMCEFWSRGGFNTVFSVFEAASLSHILGKHYVPAEAFTSGQDGWRSWPGSMKQLNDWAFGAGVNRITFHRATHQPEEGKFPGMTMAFYGVHWERTQSWWPLVSGFHKYLARSQFLLQSGNTVADILYLLPEDSPQVFTPPASATLGRTIQSVNGNDIAYGDDIYRDRRGYNFDVCDTTLFIKEADVQEGRIVFPSGMSYSLLVLPDVTLMTPELLARLDELVEKGAKILVSGRPEKSPSLAGYPECDQKVRQLSDKIWNDEALKNQVFHATVRQNRTPAWQGAKWVWYPEDMNPATSAPEETRYFRRTITVPDLKALNRVTAIISADNSCSLTVNGNYVGTCGTFHEAAVMDATSFFRQGENLIEITANNSVTGERNPAGLIAQFDLDFNGNVVSVVTDSEWETSRTADFAEPVSALVLTENVPWPIPAINVMKGEIYPDYSATSAVFAELGVVPDFESSQDLFRYTHRRIPADGAQGACDCYFVSNRADVPVTAEVRFRMTGKAVSLWNPMNGKRYRLADSDQRQVREENGQTVFPLSLDSADSIFVVFEDADKVDDLALLEPWQPLSPRETLLDITDNWDVAFDTRFGGPSSTHFDRLIDWSASSDPGIRYFSGMATCTREFELPASEVGQSLELDLGDVEVMARVIVNGHDCGIFWKAPYRVDITDAVVAGTNKLEVQVANLWGNRLIGDSALPEEQRFTRTTWSPYRPDDKLFPSGLIGPVKLQKVK